MDPYAILNIPRNASNDEIKKAYKKMAMKYHPDKNVNKSEEEKEEAEQKFKQINEAYDILINHKQIPLHVPNMHSNMHQHMHPHLQIHNINNIMELLKTMHINNNMQMNVPLSHTSFTFTNINGNVRTSFTRNNPRNIPGNISGNISENIPGNIPGNMNDIINQLRKVQL